MEAVGLVFLNIVYAVRHSAAEFQINRPLAKPAPALKGTRGNVPAASQFFLIQIPHRHRTLLSAGSKTCEEFARYAGRNRGGHREETREEL
jgi:hypothetical protein